MPLDACRLLLMPRALEARAGLKRPGDALRQRAGRRLKSGRL